VDPGKGKGEEKMELGGEEKRGRKSKKPGKVVKEMGIKDRVANGGRGGRKIGRRGKFSSITILDLWDRSF